MFAFNRSWPDKDSAGTLTVRRVKMSGAYTQSGQYRGVGAPLWEGTFEPTDDTERVVDMEVRALTRAEAVRYFKSIYPKARMTR